MGKNGAMRTQGFPEAIQDFKRLAEAGDAEAQGIMGDTYYLGISVRQSSSEAAKWYGLAAEQGIIRAQVRLGACYVLGKGIERNFVKGYAWILIGSMGGDKEGLKVKELTRSMLTPMQIFRAKWLSKKIFRRIQSNSP